MYACSINIYLHFSCKLQRLNKLLWQLNEQKGTDVGVTIKINKRGKIMSEQNKKRETKTQADPLNVSRGLAKISLFCVISHLSLISLYTLEPGE